MTVPIIIKIFISLAVILIGNKILRNLSLAVVLSTLLLAVWSGHSLISIARISSERFFSLDNTALLTVVLLVIWLSSQMDRTFIMRDLVSSLRSMLSPRSAMAVLPAVIGLLPMPGGALFSAPLVDDCDEKNEVPALLKSQINYWFRHIWELTWPLYPGVLLAMELSDLQVHHMFIVGIPMMATMILTGYFFILRRAVITPVQTRASEHHLLKLMGPIIIIVSVYFLIMTVLPGIHRINKYLPMIIGITISMIVLQLQRPLNGSNWKEIIFSKRALNLAVLVALIRIYGAFIEAPLPGGVLLMEQMRQELNFMGIPLVLLVMLISFLSGLTTGISVGFVGASFPIAFSLLGADADVMTRLGILALTYPFGFMGVMLSPVHVCFIVTNEHFKTSLLKSMGRIIVPSMIVLGVSFFIGQAFLP
ncbi:MAG: DUF401 family protein [Spirochaetota bacterium]|nr:DUF401 family protein [Spirochaetota bacterium]